MNFILICLAIGSLAGILSGLFGVGGGIIMIPAMVYLLGFNQHLAQGTSLAVMLLPVSIFAAIQYYKTGNIDIKAAFWIMLALALTSFFGAKLGLSLNNMLLQKLFGIIMLIMSLKLIFAK